MHEDVLLFGDKLFENLAIRVSDLQTHLALRFLAEGDRAGNLGQRALVLR